jgi:acetyl esterase/lipase
MVLEGVKMVVNVRKRRLAAVTAPSLAIAATVNGYRPLAKKGYPSVLAYLAGVLVTELPQQMIALQVAGMALVARWLSPRNRRIAGLASATSALGLLGLNRIGHRAHGPLTAALDVGLGADRRTESAGLWRHPEPIGGTAKQPGLVRMMRIYRDYAHDANIPYGGHGRANHLDVWRRPDLDRAGHAPVLIQIPGGAWTTGNKRGQAHPLMSHLTELGWICVSINYRQSPRNTWPDHLVDVKRAIAWVKEHIADYGGDPNFVAITGGSAGGHLSALTALTANDATLQPGFEDADTAVQAAIPYYGVYDFTRTDHALHPMMVPFLERLVVKQPRKDFPAVFAAASPITHIDGDAPPFFVLHGRNDSFIPVEQARAFVNRLREGSTQPVVYAELPVAQHSFDIFGSVRAAHAAVAVEQFLAEVYSRSVVQRRVLTL